MEYEEPQSSLPPFQYVSPRETNQAARAPSAMSYRAYTPVPATGNERAATPLPGSRDLLAGHELHGQTTYTTQPREQLELDPQDRYDSEIMEFAREKPMAGKYLQTAPYKQALKQQADIARAYQQEESEHNENLYWDEKKNKLSKLQGHWSANLAAEAVNEGRHMKETWDASGAEQATINTSTGLKTTYWSKTSTSGSGMPKKLKKVHKRFTSPAGTDPEEPSQDLMRFKQEVRKGVYQPDVQSLMRFKQEIRKGVYRPDEAPAPLLPLPPLPQMPVPSTPANPGGTREQPISLDSEVMEDVEENLRIYTEALQRETRNSPASAPLPPPPATPRPGHLQPVGGLLTVPNLLFSRAESRRETTATAAAAIASTGGMLLAHGSSNPPAPTSTPPNLEQVAHPKFEQGPPPADQEISASPNSTPNQPLSDRTMMPPPPLPLKADLPSLPVDAPDSTIVDWMVDPSTRRCISYLVALVDGPSELH